MNLYPIAFHNDNDELWRKWLYEKTGLPTKPLYQAWCQLERFSEIKSWVEQNSPKAIICTGTTYLPEFLMAFDGQESVFVDPNEERLIRGNLFWKSINKKKTILFITPFLGTGGLRSDAQIEECGIKIKEICDDHFEVNWC